MDRLLRYPRRDATVQAEGIVIISARTPRIMLNKEMRRIVALGICVLFLEFNARLLSSGENRNLSWEKMKFPSQTQVVQH